MRSRARLIRHRARTSDARVGRRSLIIAPALLAPLERPSRRYRRFKRTPLDFFVPPRAGSSKPEAAIAMQ
jgi:hypothetical protein